MPTCVPMRALKETAEFAQTVRDSPSPVIVTKNGREALVVMTPEAYEGMQMEIAKGKLMTRIAQAESEIANGNYMDADAAIAEIRARYAI